MSNAKLDKLYDEKWELEAAVRKVNDETKVIKYDNIPQEIYIKVMGIMLKTRCFDSSGVQIIELPVNRLCLETILY